MFQHQFTTHCPQCGLPVVNLSTGRSLCNHCGWDSSLVSQSIQIGQSNHISNHICPHCGKDLNEKLFYLIVHICLTLTSALIVTTWVLNTYISQLNSSRTGNTNFIR